MNASDSSAFDSAGTIRPQQIWDGVTSRSVQGANVTLGLIELAPHAVVPEHTHVNEQLGILIAGSLTFTIGGETSEAEPGGTWCIRAHVPHTVVAGPEGAVAVEVFSPPRADWAAIESQEPRPGRWP
jgi:quercetin dioxygenase-like cupin family protein